MFNCDIFTCLLVDPQLFNILFCSTFCGVKSGNMKTFLFLSVDIYGCNEIYSTYISCVSMIYFACQELTLTLLQKSFIIQHAPQLYTDKRLHFLRLFATSRCVCVTHNSQGRITSKLNFEKKHRFRLTFSDFSQLRICRPLPPPSEVAIFA